MCGISLLFALAAALLALAPSAWALESQWATPTGNAPTWGDVIGVTLENILNVLMPYRGEYFECRKQWGGCIDLVWEERAEYHTLRNANHTANLTALVYERLLYDCLDNSTRASAATRVLVDYWETCRKDLGEWMNGRIKLLS